MSDIIADVMSLFESASICKFQYPEIRLRWMTSFRLNKLYWPWNSDMTMLLNMCIAMIFYTMIVKHRFLQRQENFPNKYTKL